MASKTPQGWCGSMKASPKSTTDNVSKDQIRTGNVSAQQAVLTLPEWRVDQAGIRNDR